MLTDGNYKHTYSALRSLTKRKISTGILFPSIIKSPSFFSLYVKKRLFLKYENEREYFKKLICLLKKNKVDVLVPIGLGSCSMVSKHKEEIKKYTNIAIADYESMKIAENKKLTFEFAEKIKIPIPKTYYINHEKELDRIVKEINYPCIIKGGNIQGVIYCNTEKELLEKIKKIPTFARKDIIIQEYVKGKGTGFYGIFDNGKCKAYFMHERVHEYPITGGPSSMAKSVYHEDLKELGIKILSKLNWHGVAMVEFKRDEKNNLKLIEINPKFWGSLELSIKSGVDFPYLYYLLAKGEKIPKIKSYEKNVYFRWVLPYDLLWLHFSNKSSVNEFKKMKKKIKLYENIYYDDPLVNVYNFLQFLYRLKREVKYPHGRIEK